MKRITRFLVVVFLIITFSIGNASYAFASLKYTPDYSTSKEVNSYYLNDYFQEFCNLKWHEETSESTAEWLRDNNLYHEIIWEDGFVSEIKVSNKDKSIPIYEIYTSYSTITVEDLSLGFSHDSGKALLENASFTTPESLAKLMKYYEHFYDVEIEMIGDDTDYPCAMLSGDYFTILIAQLSEGHCYVLYWIAPKVIYYNP
ncbi:MAG: hypothetical protein IJ237_05910 [Oscillospiraceae bacterium]|nr:hypothetical protein [Oscillospiraceae bacterium]